MAKKVESQLVITARDLGTKKLKEVAAAFRQIRQEQKETAAVADRTQVSMAELRTTISQLEVVMKQIDQRRALVDSFNNATVAVEKATQRLTGARDALAKYQAELKQTGATSADAREKLRSLASGVKTAETALDRAQKNADKFGQQIKDLGLDSRRSQVELQRLGAVTQRALREATAAADQLPRQQRAYREELKQTEAAQRQLGARQKEIAAEAARRTAIEQAALQRENALIRQQAAELERVAQKRRDAQVAFARDSLQRERQVVSGFAAFSRAAPDAPARAREAAEIQRSIALQQRADAAEARLASRKQQTAGILARLGAAYRAASGSTQQYANSQQRAAAATKRAADVQRTALDVTQRLRGQVLSLVSAYIGVFGAIDFGRRGVQAFNDRLSLQRRLLVAAGDDTRAAAADYQFLRQEAQRLGFSLNQLGGVYSKLAIAGSSAGLSTKETQEIFSSFAEVSRVNNLTTEETGRVFRALEQILSKGKVQAEELRGQLGDVLPGAATTFAEALGVTTEELNKLLERGAVSSSTLVQFAETYRTKVAGQLNNANKSLSAQLGRLQFAYEDFLQVVAEGGLAEAVGDVAGELSEFFRGSEGKEFAKDLAAAFRVAGDGVLYLLRNIEYIIPLLKVLAVALAISVAQKLATDIVALGIGFATLSGKIGPATKAIKAFYTALVAGEATGAGASLIRFLSNPIFLTIAATLGALAFQINKYQKAVEDAKTPTDAMAEAIEQLELARGTDEEGKWRRRIEFLAREARGRIDAAKATIAQARANLELVRSTQGPLGDPGERAARASTEFVYETKLKEAEAVLAKAENDIALFNNRILGLGTGRRGGKPMAETLGRDGTRAEVDTEEADKDALKKRQQLEEQASALALQVYRDRLQQILELDEENLEAKLALIRSEYDERIKQAKQLEADLAAVGADNSSVSASIAELERQREAALNEERRLSLVRQRAAEEKAAAEFIKAREEEIDRLIDEHARKREQIEQDRAAGRLTDLQAARKTQEEDLRYQDLVQQKVQQLRDFINGLDSKLAQALGADELLTKLDEAENKIRVLDQVSAKAAELREQVAQGGADAFAALGAGIAGAIQGVNSLGDAFKSARDAFLNFAADFLIEIGKMIIKQALLNALQQAGKDSQSGGFFGALASVLVGSNHTGGMVGSSARSRTISPLAFAGAARYHNGGMVGLGPDEVPIIAKRGEEVVTADDPRNRMNGGMSKQPVQIINQIDSGSVIEAGLASPAGGNAILNHVRANKAAFKALLA